MFVKNWYKLLGAVMCGEVNSNGKFINYAGTETAYSSSLASGVINCFLLGETGNDAYPSLHTLRTSIAGKGGVIIGTGAIPPTVDDYCLSGDLITGCSATSNVTTTSDTESKTYTSVLTITNNNADAITIGEIGLVGNHRGGNVYSEKYTTLVERTVLDEPLTIPAGGIGQVTYTIRMNYPTA